MLNNCVPDLWHFDPNIDRKHFLLSWSPRVNVHEDSRYRKPVTVRESVSLLLSTVIMTFDRLNQNLKGSSIVLLPGRQEMWCRIRFLMGKQSDLVGPFFKRFQSMCIFLKSRKGTEAIFVYVEDSWPWPLALKFKRIIVHASINMCKFLSTLVTFK